MVIALDQVQSAIAAAGGGPAALAYTEPLFEKISVLKATGRYEELLGRMLAARDQGDFRGRVLEVNFAHAFESSGIELRYESRQGMAGDIDFSFDVEGWRVFIETKLRTQDRQTALSIERQLEESGTYAELRQDDTADIARIQIDLLQKSSTTKFSPTPAADWVNIVAVDVSELQLGAVDFCDCILAAAGNEAASRHCHPSTLRHSVLGFFEPPEEQSAKKKWLERVQALALEDNHPRGYIHGALFLFREPSEPAALSYSLKGPIVWNRWIVSDALSASVGPAIHRAIPLD